MKKILVAYFSATGVTRTSAEMLASVAKADLFEIKPEKPYTAADLDWTNKESRSTLEMQDVNSRPALAANELKMAEYDAVFIGFPIWWGREPSIIDSFIEAHDFTGKCVIPFCTSGSGGFTNRGQIEKLLPGIMAHKELGRNATEADVKAWIDTMEFRAELNVLEYRYDTQLLIEGEKLDEDAIYNYFVANFEGDSLLAVGDSELIKIHFHTNAPWKVLEYCASLGEIYDIVVEDMDRQSRGLQG